MDKNGAETKAVKFAGMEVPPELSKTNFLFLFVNTIFAGVFMTVPAVVQPAFLKDVVNVAPDFFGSVNGLLQNMSQIATLAFVGIFGALSDRTGRKILAFLGFVSCGVFFYLMGIANEVAAFFRQADQ